MKPEYLRHWQPQATDEQLNDFIQQNATLMILLEEAWQKFAANLPPTPPPAPTSQYAPDVDWETLEHFPVSNSEMIEFLNHFEKERHHNDQPFGNDVQINEQNWQIEGLEENQ